MTRVTRSSESYKSWNTFVTRAPTPFAIKNLARSAFSKYPSRMATIIEIEKLALDLPARDRAMLIANLLDSLPPILSDDDEGIAEALRRDAELDADPSQAISIAEFDSHVHTRRD